MSGRSSEGENLGVFRGGRGTAMEPKTGTAQTVPTPNRNQTEPNRGHPEKSKEFPKSKDQEERPKDPAALKTAYNLIQWATFSRAALSN